MSVRRNLESRNDQPIVNDFQRDYCTYAKQNEKEKNNTLTQQFQKLTEKNVDRGKNLYPYHTYDMTAYFPGFVQGGVGK